MAGADAAQVGASSAEGTAYVYGTGSATPTFALTGPTSGSYTAGQTVPIQWTAGNVGTGSTISLCYDTDTVFNGNEHWIEIDQVAGASGNGSYNWNTTGMAPGTYYIGGYLYSGGARPTPTSPSRLRSKRPPPLPRSI